MASAGRVIPLPSSATPHGAICRATRGAGPVFARRCVPRRSFGMTKLHSSRLASRKNRLRRGRVRNGNRPYGKQQPGPETSPQQGDAAVDQAVGQIDGITREAERTFFQQPGRLAIGIDRGLAPEHQQTGPEHQQHASVDQSPTEIVGPEVSRQRKMLQPVQKPGKRQKQQVYRRRRQEDACGTSGHDRLSWRMAVAVYRAAAPPRRSGSRNAAIPPDSRKPAEAGFL